MLKAYGDSYQYDPATLEFSDRAEGQNRRTRPRVGGDVCKSDDGTINHNFRTLIIDASGHLQMVFPTGGDLSDEIVAEIIKAAAVTNQFMAQNQRR